MKELPSTYNPQETESRIYQQWLDSGYFNPDNLPAAKNPDAKPFNIVLPPPNVTGTLHTGHALMLVIQDILIRYHRMQGFKTLWLPGTDHAAIATQSKVESIIYKEQEKTRHDLGREKFLKVVEKFAQDSHDTIVNQTKKMGSSLDWSREAYTLDDQREVAVRTAFKKMYDAGLIYRGNRIVNWDPKLQTTVSDDEIEWKDEAAPLYFLKYGPFTIATARPETKFGDKYVVVHPEDKRYAEYKDGQKIELEWINGPVTATVIKDDSIDMEFGTGAMTITPWHDTADYAIASKHKLEYEQVIDLKGKLLPIAGEEFAGLHIKKARPAIVEKMQSKGLVEKIDEKYNHRIATNSRGGGIMEPQIMLQWFVDVNKEFELSPAAKFQSIKPGEKLSLKQLMRRVVESSEIKIVPDYFSKTYYNWIDNLYDWCISRQIWYGHRIPIWYKGAHGTANQEIYCGLTAPEGEGWEQDSDTLDTWFSSGMWTFSTLGWPKQTADMATFHPTTVLETGYDILFFWVAKMVLMTGYLIEDIPFKTVYLHGLVRDKDRQKISKSKGNTIDPLDVSATYGTDALRFALIFSTAAGSDIPWAEEKIKGMKHFANKVWNIARYVLGSVEDIKTSKANYANIDLGSLTEADKQIIDQLNATKKEVTENIDGLRLHEAAQSIYQFAWHELADKYIEASKNQLKEKGTVKTNTEAILTEALTETLKMLHPFMPFVTEELWQHMQQDTLLLIAPWQSK